MNLMISMSSCSVCFSKKWIGITEFKNVGDSCSSVDGLLPLDALVRQEEEAYSLDRTGWRFEPVILDDDNGPIPPDKSGVF